jgi:uncharacterized protein YbjQ (UPF0145 family)
MEIGKIISGMVATYGEIEAHNETLKQLKEEVKAIGADPAIVAAVARAIFQGKSGELKAKSESIVELIQEQNGS